MLFTRGGRGMRSKSRSRDRQSHRRQRSYSRSRSRSRDRRRGEYSTRRISPRRHYREGRDYHSRSRSRSRDRRIPHSDRDRRDLKYNDNRREERRHDSGHFENPKLAALNHESYVMARQRERDGIKVKGLWPDTPPHASFHSGLKESRSRRRRSRSRSHSISRSRSRSRSRSHAVEKPVEPEQEQVHNLNMTEMEGTGVPTHESRKVVGPTPITSSASTASKSGRYGGDLLPGEGNAIANFVVTGERIPRRGEIGLTSNEISHFEKSGYVMSGSRHHVMNAVRMRKENQVISAEEKRMLGQMAVEERVKREEEIVKTFKSMVDEKLKHKRLQ